MISCSNHKAQYISEDTTFFLPIYLGFEETNQKQVIGICTFFKGLNSD